MLEIYIPPLKNVELNGDEYTIVGDVMHYLHRSFIFLKEFTIYMLPKKINNLI